MHKLNSFFATLTLLLGTAVIPVVGAQSNVYSNPDQWSGIWIAEGTLFSIAVTVYENDIKVEENQSLGFMWTAKLGSVEGNKATIEANYAGATGLVIAELTGDGTAVAYLARCVPEFMVVCALANGRRAAFRRTGN